MSTPLRFLGSPIGIIGGRHFSPARLIKLSGGEPWTPDSVQCLRNTPPSFANHESLMSSCSKHFNNALEWEKNITPGTSEKVSRARRLPWSDGGKCAPSHAIEDVLAEPLPLSFLSQGKLSPHCHEHLSVNTPDRANLPRKLEADGRACKILGKGTFGKVIAAIYHGRLVAAKLPSTHHQALEHLSNESNACNLSHPNIVETMKVVQPSHKSNGMCIMEHVVGYSLQKLLQFSTTLYFKRRTRYSLHIAQALEYCHNKGVLHLDVKPKNVLLDLNTDTCKLCDFGCSTLIGSEKQSAQGTVRYTAPELLRGLSPSPAADVFSLGITMWQLFSGEIPYGKEEEHSIIYKVVSKGHRPALPNPKSNGDEMYLSLVQRTWSQHPSHRLSVIHLIHEFKSWLGLDL